MSITIDRNGRRSISVSVDVAGSVDEVWEAVSTGAGVSGWFLPSEFQFGFDGEPARLLVHLGPHTDKVAEVKGWDAPHRFHLLLNNAAPGVPATHLVCTLVPSDEGCRVRVEQSFEDSSSQWDPYLRTAEKAWKGFLAILKVYMAHFSGKRCQACTILSSTRDGAEKAWEKLAEPLGLLWAGLGERSRSEPDAPVLAGIVEPIGESTEPYQALLRLDEPSPGIAHLEVASLYGQNVPTLRLYFYGDQAAAVVRREEPRWQAWLSDLFSPAS